MNKPRIALITGSARGMGREHALTLTGAGWGVAICDLLSDDLAAVAADIKSAGGLVKSYAGDITEEGFATEIADDVATWGVLAAVVNNAGIGSAPTPMSQLSVDDFRRMFEVHVLGSVLCIKAALPQMLEHGFGRIVNIASYCALTGSVGYAHYCAAKAALIGLTRTLARELASDGITVNAVAPGLIETPMTASDSDDARARALSAIPVGRYGRSGEVAALVRYLLSDESGFVTGQVLQVDGGMVIG